MSRGRPPLLAANTHGSLVCVLVLHFAGLANPGPVAAALWTDAELESGVCLDAIVTVRSAAHGTRQHAEEPPNLALGRQASPLLSSIAWYASQVVDARLIRRQLVEPRPAGAVNEAQQQVAFADVILLNKVGGGCRDPQQGPCCRLNESRELPALRFHARSAPVSPSRPTATTTAPQTDLVTPEQLTAIEAELHDINSDAAVVPCHRCEIDLALILDTGIYSAGYTDTNPAAVTAAADAEEVGAARATGGEGYSQGPHKHGPQCGRSCSHASHSTQLPHHHQVGTVTLFADAPLSLLRLRHWLDELLWEGGGADPDSSAAASIPPVDAAPMAAAAQALPRAAGAAAVVAAELAAAPEPAAPDIMRVKGLLHVADSCHKLVLQGVHELYDVVEGSAWAEGEQRRTKLVFIGRRLDASALRAGLNACTATNEA